MSEVLERRALNRATLARQLLLERADLTPLDAVEHLVGLQAQVPLNPYTGAVVAARGLPAGVAVGSCSSDREVVRIVVMRGDDPPRHRRRLPRAAPALQPVLDAELRRHPRVRAGAAGRRPGAGRRRSPGRCSPSGRAPGPSCVRSSPSASPGIDAGRPRLRLPIPARVRAGAAARASGAGARRCARRPPRRGSAVRSPRTRRSTTSSCATSPRSARRSVADVATWSRLTGLREVVERLRPQLRHVPRRARPRALRPARRAAARPGHARARRFLPEYDNVLLSHADRSRFVSPR